MLINAYKISGRTHKVLTVSGCFWRRNGELQFILSSIIFFYHVLYIFPKVNKTKLLKAKYLSQLCPFSVRQAVGRISYH